MSFLWFFFFFLLHSLEMLVILLFCGRRVSSLELRSVTKWLYIYPLIIVAGKSIAIHLLISWSTKRGLTGRAMAHLSSDTLLGANFISAFIQVKKPGESKDREEMHLLQKKWI